MYAVNNLFVFRGGNGFALAVLLDVALFIPHNLTYVHRVFEHIGYAVAGEFFSAAGFCPQSVETLCNGNRTEVLISVQVECHADELCFRLERFYGAGSANLRLLISERCV